MEEPWGARDVLRDAACIALFVGLVWAGCAAGKAAAPWMVETVLGAIPPSKGDRVRERWPHAVTLPGCDAAIAGVQDGDLPVVVYDHAACVGIYERKLGLDALDAALVLDGDVEKLRGLPGAPVLMEPF